jgi:uncharacterized protein YeaO (DUF488 family)
MNIKLKRAYDKPSAEDGYRILVDRIWPRGVSKQDVKVEQWLKDIAPSKELRKWFKHDPEKWSEFKKRYFNELKSKSKAVEELMQIAKEQAVTLVYAAKDKEYNNAVALKEYIENQNK